MAKEATTSAATKTDGNTEVKIQRCGIIMPISPLDGCDENHWANVLGILSDAIREADYEPNLVSAADDIGVIQKRIVQNIYENPIVVCDVSGKNPNVMLELGMRLAFDKPVIIVKDDKTSYSFDTSPIEHLSYPRDLRYHTILDFKENLARKISATIAAAKKGDHTTFLGHFGEFKVAKIDTKEVTPDDLILSQLQELRDEMRMMSNQQNHSARAAVVASPASRRSSIMASEYANLIVSRLDQNQKSISTGQLNEMVAEVRSLLTHRTSNLNPRAIRELAHEAVVEALQRRTSHKAEDADDL